ncbi:MAG: hypothetical protein ABGY41_19650 [Candidatus Poribacteria bacterium]
MVATKIPRDEHEKPTDPTAATDLDDYCRRLRDALDFARKAHPNIRAGSSVLGDAAANIRANREARDHATCGDRGR